ncbi:lamin tail domain-containing protein [Candidatus Marinimicrobia bacterium]|nr:lamin tail domain-containing protein [Candidatus Neomarinimicrobiota bacterium]
MLNYFIIFMSIVSFGLSDVFMTELTDPQNSSDAGRYVELYNSGDTDVDLAADGMALLRWTNGNADPSGTGTVLTGTISAGGFYIVCNDADKFSATWPELTCDQDVSTGGVGDSNGDDNLALITDVVLSEDNSLVEYTIVDMFGVAGEDGTGTGHEFEDGRAERAEGNSSASVTWDAAGWNIDNDSGGGDGNQYAPEGFDPGAWIGAGSTEPEEIVVEAGMFYYAPQDLVIEVGQTVRWENVGGTHDVDGTTNNIDNVPWNNPVDFYLGVTGTGDMGSITFNEPGVYNYDCSVGNHAASGMVGTITVNDMIFLTCEDPMACNLGAEGDCTYPGEGECDCQGNILDCTGECGGDAVVDQCGECGGNDTCVVYLSATVDMSLSEVGEAGMKARISTVNGEYNPSDWEFMENNGDGTWLAVGLMMVPGNTYGYNFNNSLGSGYESGSGIEGICAGGTYGNDRIIEVPADAFEEIIVPVVCWESCDACASAIEGCTDELALNYDDTATDDDGSCIYDWPESSNLFFSEYAEGSGNNKYLEIFNASDSVVDLSGYSLSSCSNGCDEPNTWDYADNVTFEEGDGVLAPGDVYVVCNGSADEFILAQCNQTFTYLSNGDDVFALTQIGSGLVLDVIGVIGEDPGNGWDVAGVTTATKDHTLVRKSSVTMGNPLWLDNVDPDTGETLEYGSAGMDEDSSEWIVLDQNTWDYLGSHTMGGGDTGGCDVNGDENGDGIINVLDVVSIVGAIVGNTTDTLECADMNGDGIINVLDIVQIVGIIVGGRTADADSAIIQNTDGIVSLNANGYIGGVQITLNHGNDFSMNITDDCLVSDYMNHGTYSILVIVEPTNNMLFTSNDMFEIAEIMVANSNDEVAVTMLNDFSLSSAYPNPFNPSTSFDVSIPNAGYLNIGVYNISGQLVDVIANGLYNENNYTFSWDAAEMPSGMYVINANFNGVNASHNISLIK